MGNKRAAIFLAPGFEEIEALTVVDVLRRVKIEIDMISIDAISVTGSHGITITADRLIEDVDEDQYDILILPGGMPGTKNLEKNAQLQDMVSHFYHEKKWIAAICAAPTILGHAGYLEGRMTCVYPGYEEELLGATIMQDAVVKDGNIITGRGMGCSIPFALAIVAELAGEETANAVKEKILY